MRRGVGQARGAPGPLRPARRDAPGVQLRLPRHPLGRRSACAPSSSPRCGSNDDVGAPTTWVLSNHDVVRHASRLGLDQRRRRPNGIRADDPQPDAALGLRRARAATTLMLGAARRRLPLPGRGARAAGAHRHAGRVPPGPDLPPHQGKEIGRDGCRVPMPWVRDAPSLGFGPGDQPWLPQPDAYADLAVDQQDGVEGSTLELYRSLLATAPDPRPGPGGLAWDALASDTVVAVRNTSATGARIVVVTNLGAEPVALPEGEVLVASGPLAADGRVPTDTTVWASARSGADGARGRLPLPRRADAARAGAPGRRGYGAERRPREHPARVPRGRRMGYRYLETDVHARATASRRLPRHRARPGLRRRRARRRPHPGGGARGPDRRQRGVPLLAELFEEFPDTCINIDIKADTALRPTVREILRHDAIDRVCIGSFSERRVRAARAALGPASRPRPGRSGPRCCASPPPVLSRLLHTPAPVLQIPALHRSAAARVDPRDPGAGPPRPRPRQARARVVPRLVARGRHRDAPAARPRCRRHRHRPHRRAARRPRRARAPPDGA